MTEIQPPLIISLYSLSLSFSILADYNLSISLWTSKPFKLNSKFTNSIDEETISNLFVNNSLSAPLSSLGLHLRRRRAMATRVVRVADSEFCLHPAGDTPTSCRLFYAIQSLYIPVIVSDNIELPFEGMVDYSEFSVFIAVSDALQPNWLVHHLRSYSDKKKDIFRRNMARVQPFFEFDNGHPGGIGPISPDGTIETKMSLWGNGCGFCCSDTMAQEGTPKLKSCPILLQSIPQQKDDVAGEVPVAFVVRSNGLELTEDAVKEFIAKQVVFYKKLHKVYFVHAIPKSPSGKILRKDLRAKLAMSAASQIP
ncbi:unnamed protein product [Camellia sinensis]